MVVIGDGLIIPGNKNGKVLFQPDPYTIVKVINCLGFRPTVEKYYQQTKNEIADFHFQIFLFRWR